MLLIVTLVLGAAAVFYGISKPVVSDVEKDKVTAAALEKAKAALIGYAVSVAIDGTGVATRPGDLPCPDLNDSGASGATCGNAAGTNPASRIGRLPWRTLGLPDLRDGDGERLWYAVSNNFKFNTRTACTNPGAVGCLNSDTRGTITIRNSAGTIIHDATNTDPTSSGVIAVVLAPGAVLRRQGAAAVQDRFCPVGVGAAQCTAAGLCNSTTAPKCNPVNYLDTSGAEDNANFALDNPPTTDGFINGVVRDASGNVIVNDRLIVITYQDLMPLLEKRVITEVSNCLTAYASANNGRYPWAAPATDVTPPYGDAINTLFGRIPDQPLSQTLLGILPAGPPLDALCLVTPALCMSRNWPNTCPLPLLANTGAGTTNWWNNWKLHVFYGVADAYKPLVTATLIPLSLNTGITPPTGCPACLTVDPPSSAADKQFVVMMAGRRLGLPLGQPRAGASDWQNPANYLEGSNTSYPTFTKQPTGPTFNDTLRYK